MKKFNKLFIILLCCVGAMSVTSCLDGDDYSGPTPEEISAAYDQMRGSYQGGSGVYANKVYFYNDTITDKNNPYKTDSLTGYYVNGGINRGYTLDGRDSVTFVLNGIEGRVFTKEIDEKQYPALRKAIENAPNQQIKGQVSIYNIYKGTVGMYFYPTSVTYKDLEYDGGKHDVSISFWYPSAGTYFMSNAHRVLQFPLVMAAVSIDGKEAFKIYDGYSQDQEKYKRALLTVQLCD